jgi:hypothetical protein
LSIEYPDLEFDVFDMNGAANIKRMMILLESFGHITKHKIIAIYDNDKMGLSEISQNFNKTNEPIFRLTVKKGKPSAIFYGILLPEPIDFMEDFTIENFYTSDKYQQAYKEAVSKINFLSNKSINTINDNIRDESKNILANSCISFQKSDFENFKPLFELLRQIKAL